jgi:hypothetical protein
MAMEVESVAERDFVLKNAFDVRFWYEVAGITTIFICYHVIVII